MTRNVVRTGKQDRPKTTVRGKRYLCAVCHKRSPKRLTTPAPWYCPNCQLETPLTVDALKSFLIANSAPSIEQ